MVPLRPSQTREYNDSLALCGPPDDASTTASGIEAATRVCSDDSDSLHPRRALTNETAAPVACLPALQTPVASALRCGSLRGADTARGIALSDRRANISSLSTLVAALSADRVPGVELWSRVTEAAVANYRDCALSAQDRSDVVMQDLAAVLLGRHAVRFLQRYVDVRRGLHRVGADAADPLASRFLRELRALGVDQMNIVSNIDTHRTDDFRAEIADGSDDQVLHAFFYQYMGYVTRDVLAIRHGSILHEARDHGSSPEDHVAALRGALFGELLRAQRDGENAATWLSAWPDLTLGVYGRDAETRLAQSPQLPAVRAINAGIDASLQDVSGVTWIDNHVAVPLGRTVFSLLRRVGLAGPPE